MMMKKADRHQGIEASRFDAEIEQLRPLSSPWCLGASMPCCLLAMAFPIHDWQFWVATGIFLLAVGWLLKGVLPIPFLSRRAKAKKQTKRVSLTIGGKTPSKD